MASKTVTFEMVEVKATKRFHDESGKRRQETRTFFQTLNPWNVNKKTGKPKTRREILTELCTQRDEWMREEADDGE